MKRRTKKIVIGAAVVGGVAAAGFGIFKLLKTTGVLGDAYAPSFVLGCQGCDMSIPGTSSLAGLPGTALNGLPGAALNGLPGAALNGLGEVRPYGSSLGARTKQTLGPHLPWYAA